MTTLLIFAVVLFAAVLLSELVGRSILSTAVLFLGAGVVAGDGVLNVVSLSPTDPIVHQIANYALFSILFTDGMRVSCRELREAWHLPGRALFLGLPLTLLGTAVLCHYVAGIDWIPSFLVGAILAPTDPAFASAILGREEIPKRLRHLLNVESGVNDGLALPFVLVLIAIDTGLAPRLGIIGWELLLGVALGIAIPWLACRLERMWLFGVGAPYEPLFALSVGLLVLSISSLTGGNLYLAAFFAGITLATVRSDLRDEFHRFGELIAELLKLAALLVFGALISPRFLAAVPWNAYAAAGLILLIVRPAALTLSLVGSPLSWPERLTAGWFGPKGFASAIYGVLLFSYPVPDAERLFHFIAVVIAGSVIAHSSTDVPIARWFRSTWRPGA